MIRHHVAQDLLSAEVAPQYLGAGMPSMASAALLSGTVETHSGSEPPHAAAPAHPFACYASPLSTVILLIASAIALSALLKPLREKIALHRMRDAAASLTHPLRIPATFSIEQNKSRRVSTLPAAA